MTLSIVNTTERFIIYESTLHVTHHHIHSKFYLKSYLIWLKIESEAISCRRRYRKIWEKRNVLYRIELKQSVLVFHIIWKFTVFGTISLFVFNLIGCVLISFFEYGMWHPKSSIQICIISGHIWVWTKT